MIDKVYGNLKGALHNDHLVEVVNGFVDRWFLAYIENDRAYGVKSSVPDGFSALHERDYVLLSVFPKWPRNRMYPRGEEIRKFYPLGDIPSTAAVSKSNSVCFYDGLVGRTVQGIERIFEGLHDESPRLIVVENAETFGVVRGHFESRFLQVIPMKPKT